MEGEVVNIFERHRRLLCRFFPSEVSYVHRVSYVYDRDWRLVEGPTRYSGYTIGRYAWGRFP